MSKFKFPLSKAHPWHGVHAGDNAPSLVNAYIEIVPSDTVKYEIDKETGHLCIDRPQAYSNICPALYGFIPQTLCDKEVGKRCAERVGKEKIVGDQDPIDICVLTERIIGHGDILVRAIPVGGLRMVDGDEADDKIIAVLRDDAVYGKLTDLKQCPPKLIDRLQHYFLTYKDLPVLDSKSKAKKVHTVSIDEVYDAAEARRVIKLSMQDYKARFYS